MSKSQPHKIENNSINADVAETKLPRLGAEDRRTAILDCADAIFLEQGFQAASMAAIAQSVGGSKGTLYNYFPSKEDLFMACVSRRCARLQDQISSILGSGGEVAETLTRVGQRLMAMLSSEEFVRSFRMVCAEAGRSPELGVAFYQNGPARGIEVLASYIARAMEEGALVKADSVRAANHFLALCQNQLSKARLCNALPPPSKTQIVEEVASAVRVFMAAYGAPKKPRRA